ncbi:TOBE domain-containing protein [Tropicibacter sp. S64]|uniref:TOBE domain-containing protein n=1 Tax=Tropicibacter sp. S64 TaxID=3415122 RepID=UPI003C7C7D9E
MPEQKRLPAPTPEEIATAKPIETAEDIPEGGLVLTWAEGQPDLIVANGDPELDGLEVTLALRPEKLNISRTKPVGAANTLKGTVIDIGYLGNISTYHVELADGLMVKSQVTNTRRIARRDITWQDTVWLTFSATAGVVLTE